MNLKKKKTSDQRRNWATEHPACWMCGKESYRGFPLETHEIERKSQAPSRWASPVNYFRTCKKCHMDDLAAMPHARQLAYKQRHDKENYNLDKWLRLRDPELKAPDRITQGEVDEWTRKLFY